MKGRDLPEKDGKIQNTSKKMDGKVICHVENSRKQGEVYTHQRKEVARGYEFTIPMKCF